MNRPGKCGGLEPWAFVVPAAGVKLHGGDALTRIREGGEREVAEGHQEVLKRNSIRGSSGDETWLKITKKC